MANLDDYVNKVKENNPELAESLKASAEEFSKKYLDTFSFNEHSSGLLFGHVQSGKTGQMLAVAAAAADKGFKFFVLVTTDNVILHRQTLERAKKSLGGFMSGFNVLGETDEQAFFTIEHNMPTLLVLKKNQKVLKTWCNNIRANPKFKDQALFILDDEADASSLNTKINQKEQSTINHWLEEIRDHAPSSLYLHVTATPQSLLLQLADSKWKPKFAFYIAPGAGYFGGDFFYSENSPSLRITPDNEKDDLVKSETTPEGFRKALLTYLVTSANILLTKEATACSFLIHPGVKIAEHDKVAQKAEKFLESVKQDLANGSETLTFTLKDCWEDLRKTKKGMASFEEILQFLKGGMPNISIVTLNSKTMDGTTYDTGLNILVGGNTLGRGVTFPRLQTVYYCRSAKTPQADTTWQHARIFGYDRDPELCRIFSPAPLIKLFRELNEANNALFHVLRTKGPESVKLLTPAGTRPTRSNVVLKDDLMIVTGGVNYFPSFPRTENLDQLDELLGAKDSEKDITLADASQILKLTEVEPVDTWTQHSFQKCVEALEKNEKGKKCKLIIRTNRNIGKGTGTLLSPDDRKIGEQYADQMVLTMYRIKGDVEKGWEGKPLWVPNIKFAEGTCFYYQMEK